MPRRIAQRLRPAIRRRRLTRLARWRARLGPRPLGSVAGGPRVLRLTRPGLHQRTLLRSERTTLRLVLRETLTRVGAPPAPATLRAAPAAVGGARPARVLSPAARNIVFAPGRAPATLHLATHTHSAVLRTRVERERRVERLRHERTEHTRVSPAAPATAPQGARPRTLPVPRTLVVQRFTPPAVAAVAPRPVEPRARAPVTALPAPAPAAGPDLDDLVERVLRRIERRAITQRERLGKA